MKSINRTMGSLRESLFEELDLLREGSIAPGRARASASLANAIVQSVSSESTVNAASGRPVPLGTLHIGEVSGEAT